MWIIFLSIIILSIVVVIFSTIRKEKKEIDKTNELDKKLQNENMIYTKKVINLDKTCALIVDDKNKKCFVYDNINNKKSSFSYEDLLDFELFKNDESIIQGRAGSAIVGGLLFGTVGMVAGALGSRRIDSYCNSMRINIIVNNLENPNITITLINDEVDKNSYEYDDLVENAQEFIAVLKYILSNAK